MYESNFPKCFNFVKIFLIKFEIRYSIGYFAMWPIVACIMNRYRRCILMKASPSIGYEETSDAFALRGNPNWSRRTRATFIYDFLASSFFDVINCINIKPTVTTRIDSNRTHSTWNEALIQISTEDLILLRAYAVWIKTCKEIQLVNLMSKSMNQFHSKRNLHRILWNRKKMEISSNLLNVRRILRSSSISERILRFYCYIYNQGNFQWLNRLDTQCRYSPQRRNKETHHKYTLDTCQCCGNREVARCFLN